MKKDKDDIVVDLSAADESLKNLSKEDQAQMKKLSEQIKKELNEEEKQRKVSARMLKKREEKAATQESVVKDERPDEYTGNYSEFLKQYSKNETADFGKLGKYDSDLDFKLNRKMRKVHLPMPKKRKILISSLVGVAAVILIVVLAVLLYKPPAAITITSMALTQPNQDGIYVVEGNYTGDKMSLDYIYVVCRYSDGSTKKIPLSKAMITRTRNLDNNGCFTDTDAFVYISYNGQDMTIRYLVEDKTPEEIIVFKVSSTIKPTRRDSSNNYILSVKDKIFVNLKYSNGEMKNIDIEDCTFDIAAKKGRRCVDGEINIGDLDNGTYIMKVNYLVEGMEEPFSKEIEIKIG